MCGDVSALEIEMEQLCLFLKKKKNPAAIDLSPLSRQERQNLSNEKAKIQTWNQKGVDERPKTALTQDSFCLNLPITIQHCVSAM